MSTIKTSLTSGESYDTLISLSKAFSATHTRQELLKAILDKVKPIFNYHSAGLFVVYEKENYHIDLTAQEPEIEPSEINFRHLSEGNTKMQHQGSPVAFSIQETKKAGGVLLQDYADLFKKFPDYPQFKIIREDDYRDCLTGLLVFQGKTLGMFCLNALEKDFFPKKQFEFFGLICDQLAIAVNNILDKEEIEKERIINATLLRITELLVTIKSGRDLLRIIVDEVKPLFSFYDIGLFVFNRDKTHLEDWATKYKELHLEKANWLMHFDEAVNKPLSIEDGSNMAWELDLLEQANGPVIIDLKEMAESFADYEQSDAILKIGHRDSMQTLLKYGGETLGFFCINVLEKEVYNEDYFPLFQGVADQIAVTVSNLLANEDILRREQEKTQLLEITENVTKLRNLPEFLIYVMNGLKSIFNFYDVGIFILTDDGQYHYDLAVDHPEISPSDNNKLLSVFEKTLTPHAGSLIEYMMQKVEKEGGTYLFDFEDLIADFPDYPQFVLADYLQSNLTDCLAANLQVGEKAFGMFCINKDQKGFYKPTIFPFFKSVTEQLSVAISNILANENLLQEKRFTEQLLEISESIASIQDRRQLLQIFFKKVKNIIPYDEYGLFVVDETGENHYELVDAEMMEHSKGQEKVDAKFGAHAKYPHKGSSVEKIMQREVAIYGLDDLGEHPQVKILREQGMQQIIAGPLLSGGKAFGMLCFNSFSDIRYTQRDLDLFKPIAEQMATAVSKILANEEVAQREQEKTNLLRISEAIASVKSREDLLNAMLDRIKPLIDYEDAVITIYESNYSRYRHFVSSSPKSRKKDAQYHEIMGKSHPLQSTPDEYVLKQLRKSGILFWETTAMKQKYPEHFIPGFLEKHCLVHNMYLRLVWNNELIGFLHFHFNDKEKVVPSKSSFYQSIADQLSATVANIIANEQVLEEKQFKETLLNITEAIVSIQDRNQLLKIMFERAQPVFGFYDVGLFVFDGEGNYEDWTGTHPEIYESETTRQLKELGFEKQPLANSVIEWWLKKLKTREGVLLCEYNDQTFADFPEYYQKELLEKAGFKESITCIMRSGGRDLGILMFNSLEENFFNEKQYPLFQAITDQVATAVSNILANEQVLEEKRFKETLLKISETVASIQGRSELLKAVFSIVKEVFPFDSTGLFVIDESGKYHTDLTVSDELVDELDDANRKLAQQGLSKIERHPSVDVFAEKGPLVYTLDQLKEDFPGHPYYEQMVQKVMIGGPLINSGKVLGTLFFLSFDENAYSTQDFPLFQAIADQLAVAVSNVLANEQILEEKTFKETLLGISEAVAETQNRNELFSKVLTKVKNVIGFDNHGIFVFSEDGKYHQELTENAIEAPIEDEVINSVGYGPFEHPGSPVEYCAENGPLVIDFEEITQKIPGYSQYRPMRNVGIKEILAGPLYSRGKAFGLLVFSSFTENYYTKTDIVKFEAISDLMSIAVNNVLTYEQVLEEKSFKETLLGVSEAVAIIQNRSELLKVIYQKIKPSLPFDGAGLFLVNEAEGWHQMIVDAEIIGIPKHHEGVTTRMPLTNTVKRALRDVEILPTSALKKHPHYPQLVDAGIKKIIQGPLRTGGKVMGFLNLNSQDMKGFIESDIPLFKAITDQLAVAVSNILANEQVLEEKQISETLLSLTEGAVTIRSREELLTYILDKLQPLFGFHDTGMIILDQQGKRYTDWSVQYSAQASATRDQIFSHYEDTSGWNPLKDSSVEYMLAEIKRKKKPVVFDWRKDFNRFSDQKILSFSRGYEQSVVYQLKTGDVVLGTFWMNYLQGHKMDQRSLLLFQGICDQLALTISNLLSTEDLVEEKRTTETLLSISEGIASIRSKPELLRYTTEKLKPVFNFYDTGVLILDKEKERYTDWSAFYTVDDSPANNRIFEHYENKTEWNPYKGSGVELAVKEAEKRSKPIVFDWNGDWSHLSDSRIMEFLKEFAYDKSLIFPFKNGSELLGAFWINYTKNDDFSKVSRTLFQGITDQLAIAISNILANEEIARREHLKTLQVETVTIFNQNRDWDERFEEFIKALQPHIPFHFASIDLWDDETDYNRCKNIERIGSNEYRVWGPDDFERASGVPQKESSSAYSIARNWHFEERKTPVTQSKAHKTILKTLNKIMDIEQHIDLSILLQDDRRFLLSLYKKGAEPYTPEQVAILQGLKDTLGQTIEKALITERVNELNQQLVEEKAYLQEEVRETYGFEEIVGESTAMQKVFEKVSEVSAINATVLILGETGTGKELIARAIHNNSPRRDRVLVKVNCAAIPSQIVESELFGHEKGAFTGAVKQRIGKFELANHGTIFLDEIGDMPLELQAKLLRVLQEREVERVGSNTMIQLDFRVIAATNKNLEELVAEGKFRADLFYRLNTFPIYLPALREREKDAELLAKHFARQLSQSLGLPFKGFSKKSLHNISTYEWPGNVRELQNVIEQSMILQKGKMLDISPHRTEKLGGARATSAGVKEIPDEFDMDYINAQKENLEKEYLIHMLEKTKWRVRGKGGAAELLDVHPNSLDYYLKKLGISKK